MGSDTKPAVDGSAELAFAWREGASRLAHLYQHDPLRVLFPLSPAGEPPEAALITTSGGLVGGDRLTIAVEARDNAACTVVAQAAEKVYRSLGADVAVSVRLTACPGAWLEWLPQETILFDGARLRRATLIERSP
ncbi:MAG: urease accessory protein UreD, partial [Alphaproteobacteria bacterium]|nr:urease accessory protein UreD [Alphaproteobacteria bacterium]